MRNILPPSLVRQSLTGHSWIGLLVGALMYLICLSGTLLVFYEEFERWEQPVATEYRDYDPAVLERTFNDYLGSGVEVTPHMYLLLPTETVPRAAVVALDPEPFRRQFEHRPLRMKGGRT